MSENTSALRPAAMLANMLRAGYDVTRWHTMPSLKPQIVASHSWGVAMIVMSLYPDVPEKLLMVQVALEHDLVEAEIGDMPRPGRTQEHKDLETKIAHQKGYAHESMLNDADKNWLAWADLIEAGMHAKREYDMGNTRYAEVLDRVNVYMNEAGTEIPLELRMFAEELDLLW